MRLIDADALASALNNGRLEEQTGRAVPFNAGVAFALTMVEYAPTIEPKRGEWIDAVPRWIPCEERLPEKDGYYLVTHQWQIFKDEYEINIDEYRHGEWVETPHSCMTVAWMPLPKPYDGERKDDETDRR